MCASNSLSQTISVEPSFSDANQKWVLVEELGKGTYGRVDACRNNLGWSVAVKSSGFKREIRKEIAFMRKLTGCTNIIRYFDHVFHRDSLFDSVMMELGKANLFDHIRRLVPLSDSEIRKYFLQVLNGVAFMHQQRIVHLDLKSGNIIIGADKQLKIADFGLSEEFFEEHPMKVKLFRGAIGTHQICAPEAFTSRYYDGRKSDIWALGVLLLEMRHRQYLWTSPVSHDRGYVWFLNWRRSGQFGSDELARFILHTDEKKRPELWDIERHSWLCPPAITPQSKPQQQTPQWSTQCLQSFLKSFAILQ